LIGADFSAIESRVLAWLADETWKLEIYRKFDSTSDPADEPYCVTASRILRRKVTPDDKAGRQIGKVADLALGYGGGPRAWRRNRCGCSGASWCPPLRPAGRSCIRTTTLSAPCPSMPSGGNSTGSMHPTAAKTSGRQRGRRPLSGR